MKRTLGGLMMAAGVFIAAYAFTVGALLIGAIGEVSATLGTSAFDHPGLVAIRLERLNLIVVGAALFIAGAVFVAQPGGKSVR